MQLGACCGPLVAERGFAEAVETLAGMGYDGVELTAWDVSDAMLDGPDGELDDLVERLDALGLGAVGLYRYFHDGTTGYGIAHPDGEVRSRTVDYLRRVAELCGRLGGSVIVFGCPEQRSLPAGVSREGAWENARETFTDGRLLSALEAAGVTICVEPLTWKTDFLASTAETAAFAREVDHPNVRTMVDGYHLLREADSPDAIPELVRRVGPHLGHVHADDASMRGPGGGDLGWGPIVAALDDIGYDGYVSVETHDVYVEGEAVDDYGACFRRSAETLRPLVGG